MGERIGIRLFPRPGQSPRGAIKARSHGLIVQTVSETIFVLSNEFGGSGGKNASFRLNRRNAYKACADARKN